MDTAVYSFLSAHVISHTLTPVIVMFTQMSGVATLIAWCVLILVISCAVHHWRIGAAVAVNLAAEALINEIIKRIVGRPRPPIEHRLLILVISCAVHHWRIGAAVAVNLAAEALINEIIKRIVGRPRPPIEHRLIAERGFSFPSGHAMASTAFYGFLIYLVYRYWRRAVKWIAIVLLALIPPIVMATRVYLGVHYASDVLAGCLYSIAYLTLLSIPIMKLTLLPPKDAER